MADAEDENSRICRIVRAHLVEEGKTLGQLRDTVPRTSTLAKEIEGLRALGYHTSKKNIRKVNNAVRALKNFVPPTSTSSPKRKMSSTPSSAKRSRPANYTYTESPAAKARTTNAQPHPGQNSGAASTPGGFAARAKANGATAGTPSGATAPAGGGFQYNPNAPVPQFHPPGAPFHFGQAGAAQQPAQNPSYPFPPHHAPPPHYSGQPGAAQPPSPYHYFGQAGGMPGGYAPGAFAYGNQAAEAQGNAAAANGAPSMVPPSVVNGGLADELSHVTMGSAKTHAYTLSEELLYEPQSSESMIAEAHPDKNSYAAALVTDKTRFKNEVEGAVSSTKKGELGRIVGLAEGDIQQLDGICKREKLKGEAALRRINDKLEEFAQEAVQAEADANTKKQLAKQQYDLAIKQADDELASDTARISNKTKVVQEVKESTETKIEKAVVPARAHVVVSKHGVQMIRTCMDATDANDEEVKEGMEKHLHFQALWKTADESGNVDGLKEGILESDLPEARMRE